MSGATSSAVDEPEEAPALVDAFELRVAAILEVDSGACDQRLHRRRNKHFARLRGGRDSRARMDSDACELLADYLALACMYSRP
jgi:hypothetical protein